MDKVDKAVIELNGQVSQTDDSYRSPTWDQLVRLADGRLSWCAVDSDHYRDGALICSEPEFMEARKRLEGKPDINGLASWVRFLAQNKNGYWSQHEFMPEPINDYWHSSGRNTVVAPGHPFGDWRQSLERRPEQKEDNNVDKIDWSKAPEGATHAAPAESYGRVCWYKDIIGKIAYKFMYSHGTDSDEWNPGVCGLPIHRPLEPRPQFRNSEHQDHKEGEGVKWESGVDLPPEGVKCEMQDDRGAWVSVEIISNIDGFSVGWSRDRKLVYFSPYAVEFRSQKSHRDKVIEAAMDVGKPRGCDGYKEAYGCLYDAGMLKLPGDEQ